MLQQLIKNILRCRISIAATLVSTLCAGIAVAADNELQVSFVPADIQFEAESHLMIVINGGGSEGTGNFTVNLPSGLTATSVTLSGCNAGASASNNGTSVLVTGLSLAGGARCTVDTTVKASSSGGYDYAVREGGFNANFPYVENAAGFTLWVSPDTEITAKPDAVTNSSSASFTFGTTDVVVPAGMAFKCRLDDSPWELCTSPHRRSGLAPGLHTFQVRAVLQSDFSDNSPATYGWTIDQTAPDTGITAQPSSSTSVRSASFSFTDLGTGAVSFQCSLDDSPFVSCTSPHTATGLAVGSHSFAVRAVDAAGNADDTPATYDWTITEIESEPIATLALSATHVSFGSQTVDTESGNRTVTLSNSGNLALQISEITVSGEEFTFIGCPTPKTLQPLPSGENSCTLSIVFVPTSLDGRSATITISSNATGSPHSITLAGVGTPAPVPGITVTPAAGTFGGVIVGSSATANFALTNTGEADLAITDISVSAASFLQSNTCPSALPAGITCDISVTFSPSAVGEYAGQLAITSNAEPSSLVIPLVGTALAVPMPSMQLSTTRVVFEETFLHVVSPPKSVTVTNAGTGPMQISSIASSGDFGYSGCGSPSNVLPGASCELSITFKPLSQGTLEGSIQIFSDAPGSPHSIALSGTGAAERIAAIKLRPSALNFTTLPVGAEEDALMRLTNVGNKALTISAISAVGAMFSQANDCPASLAPDAFCDIEVTYAPTSVGAHSGQVRIESNATPDRHVAALSGTAVPVPPAFMEVDASMDFGQQLTESVTRAGLVISNTGGQPLLISQMRLFGAPEFGIQGSCATIAPRETCTVTVLFAPTVAGSSSGRIEIASNHPGGIVAVTLVGQGIARPQADLELSVGGLGFGNQVVGSLSDTRAIGVTNTGNAPLRFLGFDLPLDFSLDARGCPAQLLPEESCQLLVTFKPVVPGPRRGHLTISSDAVGAPDTVSLSGTGCRFFSMRAARNPQRLCAP